MAIFNEILVGRYNRALQKIFGIKGSPPVRQVAGEITPAISMFYGVEHRITESWNRYAIGVAAGPVAAQVCNFRYRNPRGSGVLAVLEKVIFFPQQNDTLSWGRILAGGTTIILTDLVAKGIKVFYAYQATNENSSLWAAIRGQNPNITMFANGSPSYTKAGQGGLINFALLGGFYGIYTYDPINFSGADFAPLCALARANRLQCAPSVTPGFDGTRATTLAVTRPRLGGGTYDSTWAGAIAAAPEIITVTSYNEWHEGTQIEPSADAGVRYESYDGAWGLVGAAARRSYLDRTACWIGRYLARMAKPN